MRVLVLDGNADNLELLAMLLREKYELAGFLTTVAALQALPAVKPDVVMIDVRLTPVDAVQSLAAIRAIPAYARIPAVAMTAFSRDLAARHAIVAAGFQALVTKPVLDDRSLLLAFRRGST